MIFRHYRELATPEQAGTWFKIMPDRAKGDMKRWLPWRSPLEEISGIRLSAKRSIAIGTRAI